MEDMGPGQKQHRGDDDDHVMAHDAVQDRKSEISVGEDSVRNQESENPPDQTGHHEEIPAPSHIKNDGKGQKNSVDVAKIEGPEMFNQRRASVITDDSSEKINGQTNKSNDFHFSENVFFALVSETVTE